MDCIEGNILTNIYKAIKALFRKDVDALVKDFNQAALSLKNLSESLLTEGVALQAAAQAKLAESARAARVAGNIANLTN